MVKKNKPGRRKAVGRPRGSGKNQKRERIGPLVTRKIVRVPAYTKSGRRMTGIDLQRANRNLNKLEAENRMRGKIRVVSVEEQKYRKKREGRFREGDAQQTLDLVAREEERRRRINEEVAKETEKQMKGTVSEYKVKREYHPERIKESLRRTGTELFRKRDKYGKKHSKERQMATRKLLGAMGVIPGGGQAGAGRPRGSYKYGMPIHIYKQMLRDRQIKQQIFRQQQEQALQRRGITPERFQQIQATRAVQNPQQFNQQVQQQAPVQDDGGYRETPEQIRAQVDEELAFKKWSKERTISPTTRGILVNLMRIQNKAQGDNIDMQRRIMERKMISNEANLMRARNLFGPDSNNMDMLSEENSILKAPNTFLANPENNILRKHGRPNILQTRQAGNSIIQRRDNYRSIL